ncbi:GNAT family N-acetyltransferase [Streptomyces kaempferi]|uniref:GNAT family N-acetyltransferase n=1 Tax=Streptomyces kaempferi TaxID=333725 RepID=A0ABW3XW18_9ACTN
MIQLLPRQLLALSRWFPAAAPGPAALAEHALATGTGQWWADRAVHPRTVAVRCGDHALLRGDPDALTAGDLTPLADCCIDAPDRFLPALGTAFDQVIPWERMVYTQRTSPTSTPRLPWGVTLRRLTPEHAPALAELGTDTAWIHGTWGGPTALAASGLGWAAFHKDHILAVACARLLSSRYEDIACVTVPEHRREHLAIACVTALCTDIAARGHTPSWSCSRDNRPSRLLAWTAGFRLEREYVHYVTGSPTRHDRLTA